MLPMHCMGNSSFIMNLKSIFLNKRFWQSLVSIALPIAMQNLLSASFSMVDTFMVASLGGTVLSAVGMAMQYISISNSLIFGLSSGVALFVSQYKGAGDEKGIHRVEGMAVVFTAIITTAYSIVSFIFAESIISLFSQSPEIIEIGASYIRYVSFYLVPNGITYILCIVLRSTANVGLPIVMSATTALMNVFLNYCLIFGKLGMPAMGAAGAALATSIANWLALFVMIAIILITKNVLYAPLKDLFSFRMKHIKEFLAKDIPSILNELFWIVGITALNIIFSNLSEECYAGVTIERTIENLAFVFSIGICHACSITVGMAVGAGRINEAKEQSIRFNCIMPIFSAAVALIMYLTRYPIVSLFTSNGGYSDVSLNAAFSCITAFALVMTFRNIPYLMVVGVFRPGGESKVGLLVDMIPLFGVCIPVTALLAFYFKLPFSMVYLLAYVLEDVPKLIICFAYYFSGKWIKPVTPEGREGLEQYLSQNKLNRKKFKKTI